MKRPLVLSILLLSGVALFLIAGAGMFSAQKPAGRQAGPAGSPPQTAETSRRAGVLRVDAGDARYFTRDGEFWYLAGYYPTIAALTADQTDYEGYYREFINLLAGNNLNYFRNVFNMGQPYGSATTVYRRTGPGEAVDGGLRFDLEQMDPAYFAYWRKVIEYAGARDITVQLVIFDSWHNKMWLTWESDDGREWGMKYDFYCGENNVNGIDACSARQWHDPGHPVFEVQKALVRRVVDELGGLPNIVWEISNENYTNLEWELLLADYLTEYEASRGFPHKPVMPRDLPNHDGAGGKVNNLRQVSRELSANAALQQPLIADNDGGGHVSPAVRRKKAWTALVSGGHIDYFHEGMYELEVLRSEDVRLGMYYIGMTRRFLEHFDLDLRGMQDCSPRLSRGACLEKPGERAVIYLDRGGKVEISGLPAEFAANWFDPRTGEQIPAEWLREDGAAFFTTPDGQDWVLYLARPEN